MTFGTAILQKWCIQYTFNKLVRARASGVGIEFVWGNLTMQLSIKAC